MPSTLADRIWAALAAPQVGDDVVRLQARTFSLFLLVHLTARAWLWDLRDDAPGLRLPVALVISACLLIGLRGRLRLACSLAAVVLGLNLVALFPHVANHYFLELLCVGGVAFFDLDDRDERRLLLSACRAVTVLVLLWSGLQKISYGTYFRGDFLGYMIAASDRFRDFFRWVVPQAEIDRLVSLGLDPGAGPFSVQSAPAVLLANATYLLEIVLALALVSRSTRKVALWVGFAFVILMQSAARELTFGALMLNLLLLFHPRPLARRLLPLFAIGYLVLLGVSLALPWKAFN